MGSRTSIPSLFASRQSGSDHKLVRRRRNRSLESLEKRAMLDSTVVFSELMYHPLEEDGTEWIELHNQLAVDMDLSEWQLRGGVEFDFPDGTILGGGDYLVVASDPSAVEATYGISGVLGPFSGQLNNGGDEVQLYNNDDRRMNEVDFSDAGDWPTEPDGGGASLTKVNRLGASEEFGNWSYSATLGGTPGEANAGGTSNLQFNEIDAAVSDSFFVEIANDSSNSINVANYVIALSGEDGGETLLPNVSIPSGGSISIAADALPGNPVDGDRVFLYSPGKAELLDARGVTNSLRGRSEAFDQQWLWPAAATPGSVNQFEFHDEIVINEIMYHAPPQLRTAEQPFAQVEEEWIELYNRSNEAVDVSGWRLRDAVDFDIPADTIIPANQYLVVAKNPLDVQQKYGLDNVVGGYTGSLSNRDDRIRLSDANKNPADDVHYFERGHWPEYADGGGSSLELGDPFADNSKAETWHASDAAANSEWTEYSYTGRASEPLNCCTSYNEWIFGMLDGGEFLLDDVSVLRSGSNTQLIQNGTFESDALGSEPDTWRFVGNHSGTVIEEPGNPSNQVVHVVATGAQQIISDYVSTTFQNNTGIRSTSNYTVSFRAKWLTGNQQLNNRFYLTRMSNTAILDAPEMYGTPGAVNSTVVANAGPTYESFAHAPIQPSNSQDVTVTVAAQDNDGVADMTLWYRAGTSAWRSVAMTQNANGQYEGEIPNQSSNRVVQFYVEGTDSLGATSTYPRRGRDSRALYQVARDADRSIDTLRFIVTSQDEDILRPTTTGNDARNMSNGYVGSTLVRNGEEVFYDVEARQIGSRWIRPNSGYKIRLRPDQKYNGVHDSLRFDTNGLKEILFKQMVNRAGGSSVSLYDDIARMVSPFQTDEMLLGLARYEDVYLDEQFDNGADGTKWELDDITYPTDPSPSPEGTKQGQGSAAVSPQDMRDRGDDPEAYRGQLLIKNNRTEDDFQSIVDFVDAINKSGSALREATAEVMDVDLWMRHYATQAIIGNWDTYGFRRAKNLRIYTRPSDGKVIPLFWDADLANFTEPLVYNGGDSRLDEIRNLPENTRLFWGHMVDLVDNGFNGEYAAYWASHYNSLGAGTQGELSKVTNRASQVRGEAESAIPVVPFRITTNDFTTDASVATISGSGWINVREIRVAGSDSSLDVTWTDSDSWQIDLPVDFGVNNLQLQAVDFRGNLISTDTINVTSTAVDRPLRDRIRISEINFNPAGSDDTEFVELVNTEPAGGQTYDLSGVRFTEGIRFDFSGADVSSLAPGERLVVVKNAAATQALYGNSVPIAGEYEGSLDNGGENLALLDATDFTIQRFRYNDGWQDLADGGGYSLTIIDTNQDLALWGDAAGWRISDVQGGSPGTPDMGVAPGSILINEVSNNDSAATGNWVELHNTTDTAINVGGWFLSDDPINQQKFRLVDNTTIAPGGYLVLNESIDFGAAGNVAAFGLDATGGELHLRSANPDGLTGYIENQSYSAASANLTQGLVDTSNGSVFATLADTSKGATNSAPQFGPLVITELSYNSGVNRVDFIELSNLSDAPISLNGNGERWAFSRGINFEFPAGATIGASGYAVVVETSSVAAADNEIAIFRLANNVPANVPVFGYNRLDHGVLDNGGESLAIGKIDPAINAVVESDRIRYADDAPWPASTDGTGSSIAKQFAETFGNDPLAWSTGSVGGTPGRDNLFLDTTPPTTPTNLIGVISGADVTMAWTPAEDLETGIGFYNIYRDGELLGSTPIPWFRTPFEFANTPTVIYEVSAVNMDGAEGGRSSAVSVGAETKSFQFGADGYRDAKDAEIREGDANDNNGTTDNSLEVDGEDGGTELSVLLQWDDLSIPAGSQIVGATFSVNITNSGDTYNVSRLNRAWEEDEVTWNQASAGQSWQQAGARGASDRGDVVGELASATVVLNDDGVAMVQSWVSDPSTNHGIVIHNPDDATDGVDFDSRETSTVANRPRLSIVYLPAIANPTPGDTTLDGVVDERDITSLCHAILTESTDSIFNMDGVQGPANQADMDALIRNILGTEYGDANLDGLFNSSDLVQIFAVGEFEDTRDGNSTWSEGDWNCDGDFNSSDLVVAFAAGGFSNAAAPHEAEIANADVGAGDLGEGHSNDDQRLNLIAAAMVEVNRPEFENDKKSATDAVFADFTTAEQPRSRQW